MDIALVGLGAWQGVGGQTRRAGHRQFGLQAWGKLDTTGNDAADMAANLKGLGLNVVEGTIDLDKASMDHGSLGQPAGVYVIDE